MSYVFCRILIIFLVISSLAYGEEYEAGNFLKKIKSQANYLALIYSKSSSMRYTDDSCYIFLPSFEYKKIKYFETNSISHDSVIIQSSVSLKNSKEKSPLPEINISFSFESTNGLFMLQQKRTLLVGGGIAAPVSGNKNYCITTIEEPKHETEHHWFSASNKSSRNEFQDYGSKEMKPVLTQDEVNGYGTTTASSGTNSGYGNLNSTNSPEIQTYTSGAWPQTSKESSVTTMNQNVDPGIGVPENGSNTITNINNSPSDGWGFEVKQ